MLYLITFMLDRFTSRLRGEKGEVSLEYALVGGLMAVAIVAGIVGLTGALSGWFSGIGDAITDVVPVVD